MTIKVGNVSISKLVEQFSTKKINDLETDPPAEILREQESLEKSKSDFEKLYYEEQEKEKEFPEEYREYYFRGGKLFKDRYPELVGLMESIGRPDPETFIFAVDHRDGFWFYAEDKYNNRHWDLPDSVLEIHYGYGRPDDGTYECIGLLYERAKFFLGKIKQDEKDIKDLKDRYVNNIKSEADKAVREAMKVVATEGAYDLVYDPLEVPAITASEPDDLNDKVLAKLA